jgi:hypothetical protein
MSDNDSAISNTYDLLSRLTQTTQTYGFGREPCLQLRRHESPN